MPFLKPPVFDFAALAENLLKYEYGEDSKGSYCEYPEDLPGRGQRHYFMFGQEEHGPHVDPDRDQYGGEGDEGETGELELAHTVLAQDYR
jgi:hypothetical protein